MWEARNIQTREVKTGTEQEVLDLDNRLWIDKQMIVPTSHRQPTVFKAYQLSYEDNIPYAEHAIIGLFKQVCFVGSNVLTMPNNVNYSYR